MSFKIRLRIDIRRHTVPGQISHVNDDCSKKQKALREGNWDLIQEALKRVAYVPGSKG